MKKTDVAKKMIKAKQKGKQSLNPVQKSKDNMASEADNEVERA